MKMFRNPLSFKGRIRRMEYFISIIIINVVYCGLCMIGYIFKDVLPIPYYAGKIYGLFFIICCLALIWFSLAQGAKRLHDIGCSGWFQLIPLCSLVLLLISGDEDANEYGDNPRV